MVVSETENVLSQQPVRPARLSLKAFESAERGGVRMGRASCKQARRSKPVSQCTGFETGQEEKGMCCWTKPRRRPESSRRFEDGAGTPTSADPDRLIGGTRCVSHCALGKAWTGSAPPLSSCAPGTYSSRQVHKAQLSLVKECPPTSPFL